MRKITLGDVHGNLRALKSTLLELGAIDKDGNKLAEVEIFQVGDLCNMAPFGDSYRGFVSEDKATLEFALKVIDKFAVGNHELPFTHGPMFSGWRGMAEGLEELEEGLLGLIMQATLSEQFLAAIEVDGMLLTHAGINFDPTWMPSDPAEFADILSEVLVDVATGSLSSHDIRFRMLLGVEGRMVDDSIFWLRPQNLYSPAPFVQVVGHTPSYEHPRFDKGRNTWFLDNAGYMATRDPDHPNHKVGDFIPALVKDGDGEWVPWTRP